MPVHEQALLFGPEDSHLGILTRCDGDAAASLVCVIPNAGLIYRIGPRRFTVKLARTLAEAGIPTLRFDLAGVGDSKYVGESAGARERILASMKCAFDEIERSAGARRFIVMGICSGAANGYQAALADARVAGVFMYDGFWYRSRWTTLVFLAKRARVLGLAGALGAAWRMLRRKRTAEAAQPSSLAANLDSSNPPKEEFIAQVNELTRRGVRLCFAYGGSVLPYYSYTQQFRDVFAAQPFFPKVEYRYLPMVDHMLSSLAAQGALQAAVLEWAGRIAAA